MNLEEQVLSIEQAKHLQELGMEMNDASLCWAVGELSFQDTSVKRQSVLSMDSNPQQYPFIKEIIPTYTLQETLNKLPKTVIMNGESYVLDISLTPCASIYYFSARDDKDYIMFKNKDLLVVAYKMLCWLLENKYL